MAKPSLHNESELRLVFSDRLNNGGRTFYPGDGPFLEAAGLRCCKTGNLRWYNPAVIITKASKITNTKTAGCTVGASSILREGILRLW
jgi:hypothetical protein